jgi:hypothetical protein
MMNRSVMDRQMFRNGGYVRRMQAGGDPMMAPPMAGPAPQGMPMGQAGMPPAPSAAAMPVPPGASMDQAAMGAMQQGIDPAVLESMLQQAAGSFGNLDAAAETEDYEQIINTIRGDQAPLQERRQELAGLVGDADAAQTPDSVLTLVQPIMQIAAVDQGIGSMAPEAMNTPVTGDMAGGIMSTVNMGAEEAPMPGQGGPAPVNFNRGGPVAYMQEGGQPPVGGRQGEIFREQQALYQSILNPAEEQAALDEQRKMTQAQMLFDVAQGGLMFASGAAKPGGSPAEQLAASFVQPLGNIGARAGEFQKVKDAQRAQKRQLDLAALQSSGSLFAAERAQQLKSGDEGLEKLYNVYDQQGNLIAGGQPLTRSSWLAIQEQNPGAQLREVPVAKDASPISLSKGAILVDTFGTVLARNEDTGRTHTLSPGQILVDANGRQIAQGAPDKTQTVTLSQGQRVVNVADGSTVAEFASEPKTYTLSAGQQVFDGDGNVKFENKGDQEMTVHNVDGTLVGFDPSTRTTSVLFQGDKNQIVTVEGQIYAVNPRTRETSLLASVANQKPDYRVLRDTRNGLTTFIDISTAEGAARVAEANAANEQARTTIFSIGTVSADSTPQAKAYRIEGVGVRLSYDGGRTFVTEGENGPQIRTMPSDAQPLSDTIAADIASRQRVQLMAGNQLAQMDEQLGLIARGGEAGSPTVLSNAEAGLVRDAMQAARDGTGPYAGFAVFLDRTFAGAIPAARDAFQNTQANRQFLRGVIILGRSSLVVNPRFPVAEMEKVEALFSDPEAFFTNPETEANKLIEIKNLALAQQRSNLQALQAGVEDAGTRQAVMANNFEIERLLGLLQTVPTGAIGPRLDNDAVRSLQGVIRQSRGGAN